MLKHKKEISSFHNHKSSNGLRIFTAPMIVMAGLFTNILPSQAVIDSYRNNYRACAAQLLSAGVTAEAASQGCATALRPRELSTCVAKIKKQTEITATDALYSCSQARRPEDLATCVVGISKSTQQAINQATLTYCGRSLLPVTFAECVVGLRKEIDLTPIQSLDTCIDASYRSISIGAGSTTPPGFIPRFETVPMPSTPDGSVR
ncbi:hypothetical protein H6G06_00795 [Anabaena sphaerica FACHB-251]|uniref:Uncharacterized protein n=1 Tax=Anabaena sphaerica FACHB-251 TaxID=2692883 RepID=A0A926ZYW3_9NOST|nr:hypothetical protein [Anabaena sphaerica]MBD2292054.1 hypothetical protein [Anabaena sphaerica FACHB-251]